MADEFWRPALVTDLSQGDLIGPILLGVAEEPVEYLGDKFRSKGTFARPVVDAWSPDQDGVGRFLANGRYGNALVITHSCELDWGEKGRKGRVIVVPALSTAKLRPEVKDNIFQYRRVAFFPLHDVGGLGDQYVDLRQISFVRQSQAAAATRIASLSDNSLTRLQDHLYAFLIDRPPQRTPPDPQSGKP